MKISTFVKHYHNIQDRLLLPYDSYFYCFVVFHPGFGNPASAYKWEETLPVAEQKVNLLLP
jgi:splicing suppressor protein 51